MSVIKCAIIKLLTYMSLPSGFDMPYGTRYYSLWATTENIIDGTTEIGGSPIHVEIDHLGIKVFLPGGMDAKITVHFDMLYSNLSFG